MLKTLFAGLLGWLLLTILTYSSSISSVEEDLINRSNIKVQAEGYKGVKLTGSGRDITLSGDMQNDTDRLSLLNLVSSVYGVRTIIDETRLATIKESLSIDEQAGEPYSPAQNYGANTQNDNPVPAGDIAIEAVTNKLLPSADPITHKKIQPANDGCHRGKAEIMFPLVIHFDSAQFDLNHSKRQKLVMASQFVQRCKQYKFHIIGHSDNRGDNVSNLKLSKKRAKELKNILIDLGVDGNSLTDIGIGSSTPISSNTTDEGRAENRRVEIKITSQRYTL